MISSTPLTELKYETQSSMAGNCNADTAVDAGDISASILEIFDGDGSLATDTSGGSFFGSPA